MRSVAKQAKRSMVPAMHHTVECGNAEQAKRGLAAPSTVPSSTDWNGGAERSRAGMAKRSGVECSQAVSGRA